MTNPPDRNKPAGMRKPQVFSLDEPSLKRAAETEFDDSAGGYARGERSAANVPLHDGSDELRALTPVGRIERGFRWGTLLLSAVAALSVLAFSLWFTRFVSGALAREDWVGWLAMALMGVIAVALIAIALREVFGIARLSRLATLRTDVETALRERDATKEKRAVQNLARHYRGRADIAWGLKRLAAIDNDVVDAGERLRLADRELLRPLDSHARQIILRSAKRIATVTTLSPATFVSLIFVFSEAMGLFRKLATLYGGRPGTLGALRLGRAVIGHMVATGGIALTDDLFGQFLGQDLLRRLSRRLGEGAINGALTARLGVAAVDVLRPIPPLDGDPLRVREIFAELFRSLRGKATEATPSSSA